MEISNMLKVNPQADIFKNYIKTSAERKQIDEISAIEFLGTEHLCFSQSDLTKALAGKETHESDYLAYESMGRKVNHVFIMSYP
jgi:hypothetical protein